jgi:hypothetical protein
VGLTQPASPEAPPRSIIRDLREVYRRARARFGHQHWWPADTPFEVCVGAILTQNTAWTNVERALANLKSAGLLDPRRLYALPEETLAELIRPAGYFRVKARRLRAFLQVVVEECGGELERLWAGPTAQVRARLLRIPGVGPETAAVRFGSVPMPNRATVPLRKFHAGHCRSLTPFRPRSVTMHSRRSAKRPSATNTAPPDSIIGRITTLNSS